MADAGRDLPVGAAIPLRLEPMVVAPVAPMPATNCYGPPLIEWLGDDEPEGEDEADWVVPDFVAAEAPGALLGPAKRKKSWFMCGAGIAKASGQEFFGRPVRQGRVLVIEREDPTRTMRRRVWRMSRGMGIDPRSLADHLRIDTSSKFHFDDVADVDRLRRTLDTWRPEVVFLDSFRRTFRANENSASEMNGVMSAWADLCTEYQTAIVVVGHTRKEAQGGDGAPLLQRWRGSGDFGALVRHAVGFGGPTGKPIKVEFDGNMPDLPEPFLIELEDFETDDGKPAVRLVDLGPADEHVDDDLAERVLATLRAKGPLGTRALREATGGNATAVGKAALALAKRGRITRLRERDPWRIADTNTEEKAR